MDIKQKQKHLIKQTRIRTTVDNLPYACTRRFTRHNLGKIYKEFGYKVGAEIGVSKGMNAYMMLKNNPEMKLYLVDPWSQYYLGRKALRTDKQQERILRGAKERLKDYDVEFVRKFSMDAVKDFEDESLDFVYIDGNHQFDYVMPDLIFWAYKVKKGGMIGLHDYCHFHWSGVVKAVEAYVYCHDIRPWFITKELKPTVFWIKQ